MAEEGTEQEEGQVAPTLQNMTIEQLKVLVYDLNAESQRITSTIRAANTEIATR